VVPDDLANSLSWSEENWAAGASKSKAKSSTDNKNDEKSDE
jgi:hypothetical protein